jgi:starch synthase
MAAMLPIYMKHYYKDEALFADTKIVTSVFNQSFDGSLDMGMSKKVQFDGIQHSAISELDNPTFENIMMASINHSDGIVIASEGISSNLTKFIRASKKPFLPFTQKDKYAEVYTEFYKNQILG